MEGYLSINVVLLQNAANIFQPALLWYLQRKIMTSTFQIEIENLSRLGHYLTTLFHAQPSGFSRMMLLDDFSRDEGDAGAETFFAADRPCF